MQRLIGGFRMIVWVKLLRQKYCYIFYAEKVCQRNQSKTLEYQSFWYDFLLNIFLFINFKCLDLCFAFNSFVISSFKNGQMSVASDEKGNILNHIRWKMSLMFFSPSVRSMTQQAKTPINTFVHDFSFIYLCVTVFVNTSDSESDTPRTRNRPHRQHHDNTHM